MKIKPSSFVRSVITMGLVSTGLIFGWIVAIPVKAETLAEHIMHEERYEVSDATAKAVNSAKSEGRRIIAVGTTSVRVLESAAQSNSGRAGSPLPADATVASDDAHGVTRPFCQS